MYNISLKTFIINQNLALRTPVCKLPFSFYFWANLCWHWCGEAIYVQVYEYGNYDQFHFKKTCGINIDEGLVETEVFCPEKIDRAPEWATYKHPANCPHLHGQVGVGASHAHCHAHLNAHPAHLWAVSAWFYPLHAWACSFFWVQFLCFPNEFWVNLWK